MATANEYTKQAQALLPYGPAWTRRPDAVLTMLLSAFGEMFGEVDSGATSLLKGANPANATELLYEWELSTGLPDKCTNYTDKTTEERRNDIMNKLNEGASPTLEYFQKVAERLGYEISFMELKPFICGLSRCGDRLNGTGIVRYDMMTILIGGSRTAYFRTGVSRCGDRLGVIRRATELECIFNRLKPAHVVFLYSYE